jgi:hypothetical protein
MIQVIDMLKGMADYVIFDTPPTLAVTDAVILAARTDGTIIVTAAGKTRTEQLRETIRLMRQANARMIGVVLNRAAGAHAPYYYKRGEKPEIVQSVADQNTRVKPRKGKKAHMVEAAVALPQRTLTELAPLAAAPQAQQPVPQAARAVAQPTEVSDTQRLIEEVARITEQRPVEQPRIEVAVQVPTVPAHRPVVQQGPPVEVVRPAASLRPEPTQEEKQRRAAELWQAMVSKRDEEPAASAARNRPSSATRTASYRAAVRRGYARALPRARRVGSHDHGAASRCGPRGQAGGAPGTPFGPAQRHQRRFIVQR